MLAITLAATLAISVPKDPMVKSVKMVELQLVSSDLVGVPAQMVTWVTTAKRLLPAT